MVVDTETIWERRRRRRRRGGGGGGRCKEGHAWGLSRVMC